MGSNRIDEETTQKAKEAFAQLSPEDRKLILAMLRSLASKKE